jgi:hypothetical protein
MIFRKDIRRITKENGLLPATIFSDEVQFGNIVELLVDNNKSLNPPEIRAWIKHKLENNQGKMTASDFSDTLELKLKELESSKLMKQLAISYGFVNNNNIATVKHKDTQENDFNGFKQKRKNFTSNSSNESKGQNSVSKKLAYLFVYHWRNLFCQIQNFLWSSRQEKKHFLQDVK